MSAASIHRQIVTLAERLGETPPSYSTVYAMIRELDPGLGTMAHEGTKAYADAFDLVHRHETTGPNTVWQAEAKRIAERRHCFTDADVTSVEEPDRIW
jgi:putative transposase